MHRNQTTKFFMRRISLHLALLIAVSEFILAAENGLMDTLQYICSVLFSLPLYSPVITSLAGEIMLSSKFFGYVFRLPVSNITQIVIS